MVYVDNDPVVLVHAPALLTSDPAGVTSYIDADARDPDTIVSQPAEARPEVRSRICSGARR